jgi:hypothetical protein
MVSFARQGPQGSLPPLTEPFGRRAGVKHALMAGGYALTCRALSSCLLAWPPSTGLEHFPNHAVGQEL